MKKQNRLQALGWLAAIVMCIIAPAKAQNSQNIEAFATVSGDTSEIRWQPDREYFRLVLTVSTPGGKVLRREFDTNAAPAFKLTDENGSMLADGEYRYELRLIPNFSRETKRALAKAREKSDVEDAIEELQRAGKLPTQAFVQSGSFLIEAGNLHMGGAEEAGGSKGGKVSTSSSGKSGGGEFTIMDQVIPDDLIVQSSLCVGFDCVNNENFGFDTIRLKENNTRIKFEDTSTGTFPSNDWQLTANDSASGGANKFSIEDITGARVPFTITAGAPTNSIFVDSGGRVGFRTATPALELHVNDTDTPAMRLEQNSSGGFTAQTWDIAGNEANFFIRDVTGGSRLPFRIIPGAPTSSLVIQSSGNVGIGTLSPARRLEVSGTNNVGMKITDTGISNAAFLLYVRNSNGTLAGRQFSIFDENASVDRFVINSSGFIGIGVVNPTSPIQHSTGATLSAGGVWTNASSRSLKMNIRSLSSREALDALLGLEPVRFQYKAAPAEHHVGFIAEDVPDLVAASDRKTMSSMDVVAVLTKAVQEQQKMIEELKAKVAQLEKSNAKSSRAGRRKATSDAYKR